MEILASSTEQIIIQTTLCTHQNQAEKRVITAVIKEWPLKENSSKSETGEKVCWEMSLSQCDMFVHFLTLLLSNWETELF